MPSCDHTTHTMGFSYVVCADMNVPKQCGIAASMGNQIIELIRRIITYKRY